MRLEINRLEGLRNDLLLRLERSEIDCARLSVAHRERLMALPGMPRHRAATPREDQAVAGCKISLQHHLQGLGIVDPSGQLRQRAIAIGNRNLGTNHGHVAWQRAETPRLFHVLEDPCDYPAYSCLTAWRNGALSIEDLRFDFAADQVYDARDGRDLGDEIEWATFGQRVLRRGSVVRIEEIADQFYDFRHVLAFDHHRQEGERIRLDLYRGYPRAFRENTRVAWQARGVPRSRYYHSAIGLSPGALFVLQREGTVEEIADGLKMAGAEDGLILDNGGSVACWVWWANAYAGGIVSPTIDYRPPGTSAIAFLLKGPVRVDQPGGSVSYSVS
jgi:hypothetical protein